MLLSRYSGEEDIVFGLAVPGHYPGIQGDDSGGEVAVNILPVRVNVPANMTLLPWLKELQTQHTDWRDRMRDWETTVHDEAKPQWETLSFEA